MHQSRRDVIAADIMKTAPLARFRSGADQERNPGNAKREDGGDQQYDVHAFDELMAIDQ